MFYGVVADIGHATGEVALIFNWSSIIASFEELSSGYLIPIFSLEIHSIRLLYFSHKSFSIILYSSSRNKVKMIGKYAKCMNRDTWVLSSVVFYTFEKPHIVSLTKEYLLFLETTIVDVIREA